MGDLTIPTEPVGSIPRPIELIRAMAGRDVAFARIRARVVGTQLAARALSGRA